MRLLTRSADGRCRWIGLSVALAAAFFVAAGAPSARAQVRADRPDLRITKASFNGRDLHVEYANATGVYDRRRYEVGFQWYDASGAPVGTRHWLPQPEVERGGIAILDTKYRIDLTYRRSGGNYNRRLLDFILQRPNTAEELRVTVDDGDRISEMDETNNVARLKIPLPDLQITGAKFLSPNRLELSYRNANPSPIPLPFRIGFTWAEEGGAYASATRWINVLEPAAGETKTEVLSRTDASYITASGRQAGDRLDWYFERRPGNATRMKITIDDAGTVREANEHDNVVTARPILPDLVVRDAKLADGRLTFTYGNAGEGYIRDIASRVLIQWVDATGKPIGGARWIGFAQMDPKQTFAVNADRFDVEYAISGTNRTTTQRLSTYLRERPADAAQLHITIDDEQRIIEADERNNTGAVAFAPPAKPDLTITDATFTADALAFTVRNVGPGVVPTGQPISLWFEWVNASGARVGTLAWNDVPAALAPGQFLRFDGANARLTRERASGGTEAITFADLLGGALDSATHLKVHADGPDAIRESDETNNTVLLAKPVVPLPDLAITDLALTADQATWRMRNIGDPIPPTRALTFVVEFQWLDQAGAPVGPSTGINSDIYFPTPTYVHNRSTGYSGSASSDYILRRPSGAVALRVTEDSANVIREKDETNNIAEVALPSPPQPDLAFARVTAKWNAPSSKIEYVGTNRGTADVERVTLGLQWLDASGRASGPSYAPFEVFGRLRAGATSSTWALPFWDSGETSTRPLGRYLLLPPSDATHLRLMLDPENAVPESDEANNTAVVERPASVPLSDLTITNAKFADGAFALTYQNIGPVHAGYFMTLSTWFEWVDASGARIGDLVWHDGESLDPKYARHLDTATIVSSATRAKFPLREFLISPPSGATHLKVTVDGPNVLLESDETNNVTRLVRPAVPLADLRIADFAMDPIAPRAGERAWFVVRVENVGSAATGTQTATGITVDIAQRETDRKLIGQFTAANIASGKSFTHRWTKENYYGWVAVAGTHTIEVCADRAKVVPEGDETNNCARKVVTVAALVDEQDKRPDLSVGAVEARDGALRITVRNIGGAATAPTDIWLMWFAGGRALSSSAAVDLPAIAAGKEAMVVVPFDGKTEASQILREPPKDGTRVRIFLDGSRKVAESNEDNNDAMFDRAGLPPPKPEPPANKPPIADAGKDITARDDDGDGKAVVQFFSHDSKDPDGKIAAWTWTLGGQVIATGQTQHWREAPVGTSTVTLTVTDDKGATATDTVRVTVELKPSNPPDLVIAELTLDPEQPKPGDVVEFTARTENRGAVRVGQVSVTSLDVDLGNDRRIDERKGQIVIKDLAPNEGETKQWRKDYGSAYTWTAREGTHRIMSCADALGAVAESDERNNCREVTVRVVAESPKPKQPDLVVERVYVSPANPTANSHIAYAAFIGNIGNVASGESVAYRVLDLGNDGEPEEAPEPLDIPALGPGASRAFVWPGTDTLPAGTHGLEVCVDVAEEVEEANEENNCREWTFTVSAPQRTSFLLLPLRLVLDVFSTPIRAGER